MKFHSVLMLFALVGCDKGDDSSGGGGGGGDDSNPPGNEDADNDGYDVTEDCNDGDAAINPGATEVCDGVDNDCADGVDVGATDATDYYADGDADGYGAGKATASCDAIAGQVANGDDCDDANAAVNPAAVEICDDLDADEDCDSLIDDEDDSLDTSTATEVAYVDGDGDGYGTGKKTAVCDVGAGYSLTPGDCDDASIAANPGAAEVCGDAVDDDCDGEANTCRYSGAVDPTKDPAAHIRGFSGIGLGFDATAAGDMNGDGIGDLALATNGNGAFIVAGPVSGTIDALKATAEIDNSGSGDGVGHDVQGIGDQDGDGYDDLLVEAYTYPSYSYTGRAYVVHGPVSGVNLVDDVSSATITGDYSYDYLSWYPSAGDVNGDGVVDVMVGAPGTNASTGVSYIYYGPVSGDLSTADASVAFTGLSTNDWTGGCNAANGDINGDGIDDVLVSAEQTDYLDTDDGVAWLFYGPVSGAYSVKEADAPFYGAPYNTHLGWFSSIGGDLDGDGLDDVVVSAPYSSDGYVYVVYGDSVSSDNDVTKAAGAYIAGDSGSYQTFGNYLDSSGDLDSDGNDDLAVGSSSAGGGTGIAWVFYGPVSGTLEASVDASFTVTGDSGQGMGSSAVFVGDVTGDGADDLEIGASNTTVSSSYGSGVALILEGTAE